ncbi:MAG: hypothetical protein RMI94_01750 [Bryobacterales bacterium]|nr:hypothetical protein [Bryobacteraceae bacterium]MDW8129244.1 hypothetical protein [Bryobacterales bacterium]
MKTALRQVLSVLVPLFLAALPVAAADKPVVGTWQCVSDSPDGSQYSWAVVVKEEGGKLSGTISGAPGEFSMEDVRFEGGVLTFKVRIEGDVYTIEARVQGDNLEGTWKGPSSQGVIKGSRRS